MSKRPRIAIIGGGSSGLTAIKECLDSDFEPICFEECSDIGGLWRFVDVDENENKDPHSSVYRSTIINTCSEKMTFSDYPIPPEWPTYMHNSRVLKYFRTYAEHFNLLSHIKFNASILKASILPDKRWNLQYTIRGEKAKEEIFDYVMVCTGHHRYHRWPKYKGMDVFKGEQMHSHFYRTPNPFQNKRVMVVGVGNSGIDISVELSHFASQVYLSVRRGTLPWIFPRIVNGTPFDHLRNRFHRFVPVSYFNKRAVKLIKQCIGEHPPGLEPDSPIFSSHPTVKSDFFERLVTGTIIVKPNIKELKSENKQVEFVDESILEDIDYIIYATGYNINFPFLDKEIVSGGEEVGEEFDPEYRENLVWLYKMVFPPKFENIAFIGLAQPIGPIFPVAEMQCRYVTSLIKGLIKPLPSLNEMNKSIRERLQGIRGTFYSSARHTIQTNFGAYLDELSRDIGCYPSSFQIIRKYGFQFWKIFYFGVETPIIYRLFGRNSWDGAHDAILLYNKIDPKTGKSLSNRNNKGIIKPWLFLLLGIVLYLNRTYVWGYLEKYNLDSYIRFPVGRD
ncbi:hypothetical protein Glove_461g55 [Diversispora epigaea]|uniref:Flavin-containing monooxygenase 1 n=1 Tax=Diversispora epigaea TaxID=1348612 RepID=A0A397GWJ3_9GLOM|nr:hypothetical protein Glove_461g55 [Diversispora epigaea]